MDCGPLPKKRLFLYMGKEIRKVPILTSPVKIEAAHIAV